MSFWKTFGFHTVSAIDTLLEGEDYTLEQLLDEEEILQETKAQNKKLIDFLVEPETLKKLVEYVTQEPEDEADTKRKYKYPFLACEILASEVWAICDAFYQHQNLLEELYGFLSTDPPLNPMLVSYTCRVAGVLLQKKVSETIAFMKEKKDIISSFIKHLGNSSIMDLLLKVIACEDTPDGAGVLEWLCKTDLIPSLVSKFESKLGQDVHENAAQALVDIVAISVTSSSSPLIAQLESENMVKTLFGYILADGLNSSLLHSLSVVIELLKRHINEHHDDTTTVDQLPPLLQSVVQNIDKLQLFLSNPNVNSDSKNDAKLILPVGAVDPLGFHRLKIIEFFAILVRTNYKCVDDAIVKSNVLNVCLDLFFRYCWNNFLHTTVEQMIQGILDGENEELKKSLLVDCKLLKRIVDATQENDTEIAKTKGVRRGYMGHLITISQVLIQTASTDAVVDKILSETSEWLDYVKGPLAQTRAIQATRLADYVSSDFNEEQEEVDEYGEEYTNEDRDFNIDEDDDDDDDRVVQARIEEEEDEDDDDDIIEGPASNQQVWVEREIQPEEQSDQDKKHNENTDVQVSV
jgi:hypothetical protein